VARQAGFRKNSARIDHRVLILRESCLVRRHARLGGRPRSGSNRDPRHSPLRRGSKQLSAGNWPGPSIEVHGLRLADRLPTRRPCSEHSSTRGGATRVQDARRIHVPRSDRVTKFDPARRSRPSSRSSGAPTG
jgi:hypothetical protein